MLPNLHQAQVYKDAISWIRGRHFLPLNDKYVFPQVLQLAKGCEDKNLKEKRKLHYKNTIGGF